MLCGKPLETFLVEIFSYFALRKEEIFVFIYKFTLDVHVDETTSFEWNSKKKNIRTHLHPCGEQDFTWSAQLWDEQNTVAEKFLRWRCEVQSFGEVQLSNNTDSASSLWVSRIFSWVFCLKQFLKYHLELRHGLIKKHPGTIWFGEVCNLSESHS